MNALSSEWVSDEVSSRAHSAVAEAYESGRFSLIPVVLGAAAESYIDNTLLNSSALIGSSEENGLYCCTQTYGELRGSFRDRLESCSTEFDYLDDFWQLRNEILNSDEVSRIRTDDLGEVNIDEYVQDFEDLVGYEGESIVDGIEAGDLERDIRGGTSGRPEFLEVMTSSVYNDEDASGELLPATALAYERLSEELEDCMNPVESWVEEEYELPSEGLGAREETSDAERYTTFERQRDIISHNLEAFQELESPLFMENLDYVLGEMTEAEGLADDLIRRWRDLSDLRLGPPMFKTEAIW